MLKSKHLYYALGLGAVAYYFFYMNKKKKAMSAPSTAPTAGTTNLGGGGGGGGGTVNGAAGGKGVVILSMPDSSYSGITTGSPTVSTNVSGKTVLTFNDSGSYTG